MMKMRFAGLMMFMLLMSSAVHAEGLFPAKPASFKACYDAGQVWIRARMPELNASPQPSRHEFNSDLATCTERVPARAAFTWPAELAYRAKAPYKNFFTQDARGDWIVASYSESSDSPVTYFRMPKSGARQR